MRSPCFDLLSRPTGLLFVAVFASACCSPVRVFKAEDDCADCQASDGSCGTPTPFMTEAVARANIDSFKQSMANLGGNNVEPLRTLQDVHPGQIWVRCPNDGSLMPPAQDSAGLYVPMTAGPGSTLPSVSTSLDWRRENSVSVGVNLFDAAVSAAFSDARVQTLQLTLSLENARPFVVNQPGVVRDNYLAVVGAGGARGDIFVTQVLRGQMRMSYKVLDDQRQQLTVDLPRLINGAVGGEYARSGGTQGELSIVEESNAAATAFAATFLPIDVGFQNESYIADVLASGSCQQGTGASIRTITGIQGGEPVVDFIFEETTTPGRWAVRILNRTDQVMTTVLATFQIRNAFGIVVDDETILEVLLNVGPGGTASSIMTVDRELTLATAGIRPTNVNITFQ